MKNIRLETLDKYEGNSNFEFIEGNIYKNLEEDYYVFALSYELGGSLKNVKEAIAGIIGKRVYNEEFEDAEGVLRVKLVIE